MSESYDEYLDGIAREEAKRIADAQAGFPEWLAGQDQSRWIYLDWGRIWRPGKNEAVLAFE